MNRLIISLFCAFLLVGCATTSQTESPTCKKIRRKMAYMKRQQGAVNGSEEAMQLRQIYREYDCA